MNKKTVDFKIDEQYLYLDTILVESDNLPIFAIYHSTENYYVSVCADIDIERYLIIQPDISDLWKTLYGQMSIYDLFVKQNHYWQIVSGESIAQDKVERKSIKELNIKELPDQNFCFQALTSAQKI